MGLFDGLFSRRRGDGSNSMDSAAPAATMDDATPAATVDDAAPSSSSSSQHYGIPPLSPTATSVVHRCARSV
jgi:hypothetical protein